MHVQFDYQNIEWRSGAEEAMVDHRAHEKVLSPTKQQLIMGGAGQAAQVQIVTAPP